MQNVPQHTLSSEFARVMQHYQITPIESLQLARPRLAVGTTVQLFNGVEAVICAQSSNESQRYELTWFDRHFWTVRRKWYSRSCFEVVTQNQTAVSA